MADDVQDMIQTNADLKKKVELMRQQSINRARTMQMQLLKANAPQDSSDPQSSASGQSNSQNSSSLPQSPAASKAKSKRIVFAMSKLSLFSIILSLMLFGALIFAGGFLTGYWIGGGVTAGTRSTSMTAPQIPTNGAPSALARGLNDIGFQNIAGDQAADATQNLIAGHQIPGIPDALQPLASSVQFATSNAVSRNVGENVTNSVGNNLNSQSHVRSPNSSAPGAPSGSMAPGSNNTKNSQHFSIQLGIFATQENAQEMISRLQTKSYVTANIVPVKQPNGEILYAVNSGNYPNYQAASAVAAQFAKLNIPGAMVIPIQPQGGKK
jgi:cell division septation protein DedD